MHSLSLSLSLSVPPPSPPASPPHSSKATGRPQSSSQQTAGDQALKSPDKEIQTKHLSSLPPLPFFMLSRGPVVSDPLRYYICFYTITLLSCISSSLSLKSKTSKFSCKRCAELAFGIGVTPRCRCHRRIVCLAPVSHFPMGTSLGDDSTIVSTRFWPT